MSQLTIKGLIICYPEEGSKRVKEILLKVKRGYLCQIAKTEFASAIMKKDRNP